MTSQNPERTFWPMSGAHVRPFQAGDVPAAGALLAARHRAHRLSCPLLSPRYENDQAAAAQVAAAFALPGASGAVAAAGDDIAGFVLGAPKDSPVWGANVWVVRRAHRADLPALASLEVELPRQHSLAPVFSASPVPSYEECLAGWEKDFDDPAYTTFVAEVEGAVVGSSIGCPLEKAGGHPPLTRPDRAGFLAFAAVFPHARGLGAGRALGEAVIAWTAQAGYDCVVTDWRVTNLLSSRTWPRLGFEESFLRLHRVIGY